MMPSPTGSLPPRRPCRALLPALLLAAAGAGGALRAAEAAAPLPPAVLPPLAPPVAPPEPPPAAGAQDGAWLQPLLVAARVAARERLEVVVADAGRRDAELGVRLATALYANPTLTVTPSFDRNQSVSNDVVAGPGLLRVQSGSAAVSLAQGFSTGTTLGIGASSAGTRSDGGGVISNDFYTSSVFVSLSQALLRGGSRSVNLAGIADARDAERASGDQFDATFETVLADLAQRWIGLAQSEAGNAELRARLKEAREELAQHEERRRIGLDAELAVLSLRRGVADQEVQLAKSERAYAADLRQLALLWPGLALPERAGLLRVPHPGLPGPADFAATRAGAAAERALRAAERGVAVARDQARDDLSLSTALSKGSGDPDLGRAWSHVGDRNAYDWQVGLSYTHPFGTQANRVAYQQGLIRLDQARLQARIAARDWGATELQLRDTFSDALSRVAEQERLVAALQDELALTRSQVEAARATTHDLVDVQQRVNDATLAIYQAHLDVLRADLALRVFDNRLLGLLP